MHSDYLFITLKNCIVYYNLAQVLAGIRQTILTCQVGIRLDIFFFFLARVVLHQSICTWEGVRMLHLLRSSQ